MWMSKNLSKIADYVERDMVAVEKRTWVDESYRAGQMQALTSVRRFINLLDSEEKKKLYEEGLYDISTGEMYKV